MSQLQDQIETKYVINGTNSSCTLENINAVFIGNYYILKDGQPESDVPLKAT